MWEDIILLAIGNGLWAVLSCLLLVYLLKDSKKREAKFTKLTEDLVDRLKVVGQIQDGVRDLNGRIDLLNATGAVKSNITPLPRTHSRPRIKQAMGE